jgi:hypothetical protein
MVRRQFLGEGGGAVITVFMIVTGQKVIYKGKRITLLRVTYIGPTYTIDKALGTFGKCLRWVL